MWESERQKREELDWIDIKCVERNWNKLNCIRSVGGKIYIIIIKLDWIEKEPQLEKYHFFYFNLWGRLELRKTIFPHSAATSEPPPCLCAAAAS